MKMMCVDKVLEFGRPERLSSSLSHEHGTSRKNLSTQERTGDKTLLSHISMIFLIRSNYPSGMIAGLILFIVLAIFVLGCYLIMKIPMTGNHPNAEAAAVPLLLVWLCLGWIVCISFWPYSWSNTGVFVIMIMLCLMLAVGLFVLLRFSYAQLTYVIRRDPNALAMWTYTPTEWQQAVADEFMWGLVHSNSAQIKICQLGFLVDDGSRRRVFHLETGTRVVTFAGYLPNEGSKL